jgi:hypothetical protein
MIDLLCRTQKNWVSISGSEGVEAGGMAEAERVELEGKVRSYATRYFPTQGHTAGPANHRRPGLQIRGFLDGIDSKPAAAR